MTSNSTYKIFLTLLKPVLVSLSVMFFMLALPVGQAGAQDKAVPENQLKAVFLFNFTQFTEWPESAFDNSGAPLIIGVLGHDPFGKFLDETIANERVNGHPIEVQRYRDVRDIKNCHLLYISEKDPEKIAEILHAVRNKRVLTVGDSYNFTRQGGMIGFTRKNNKIRLQANPGVARSAGLSISSKLLRVSEVTN